MVPGDLDVLLELYRACFPGARARPLEEVRRKLGELFFDGPFVSAEVPSLVACDADGAIVGFRGWLKRRWRLGDEGLSARTENSRMVRAEARRRGVSSAIQEAGRGIIAGLGPEMFGFGGDAATADGLVFNRGTHRDGMHVHPLPQYGFDWEIDRRPLRTGSNRSIGGGLALAHGVGERLGQGLAALRTRRSAGPAGTGLVARSPLGAQGLRECWAALATDFPLHLDETLDDCRWLLEYLADYPSRGRFHARILTTRSGEPRGFFACYLRSGGLLEVVGWGVQQEHLRDGIGALLSEAASLGARRVRGRASARQLRTLIACGAVVNEGLPCRVNTARDDVRLQFESMQALVSGLEAERWT